MILYNRNGRWEGMPSLGIFGLILFAVMYVFDCITNRGNGRWEGMSNYDAFVIGLAIGSLLTFGAWLLTTVLWKNENPFYKSLNLKENEKK